MAIVTVVVVEEGSERPDSGASEDRVVRHHSRRLPQRARRKLASLRQRGDEIREAVLVCSERTDAAFVTQRAQIAHELLTAVVSGPRGRLVLSAAATASIPLRNALFALAGALTPRLSGTAAMVSVRFGGQRDEAVIPRRAYPDSTPPPLDALSRSPASARFRRPLARDAS